MPEGDAVFRTARRLQALNGKTLIRTDFRIPQLATVTLNGGVVVTTVSKGKHLLTRIRFDDGAITLHTHLKMEGSWRIFARGGRWSSPAYLARVVLGVSDCDAVGFRLGTVELVPTPLEERAVGHLGPDLLDPAWGQSHVDTATKRLAVDPSRTIGEALLDQRNLAGLGTIWRAELCFLSGIDPARRIGEVDNLTKVVHLARRLLLAASRDSRPITTGDRGDPLWVYRRNGRGCRRCGATIRTGALGPAGTERVTYWCPGCQR